MKDKMANTTATFGEPTSKKVKSAVEALDAALRETYGEKFTIRVTGDGDILAARGGIYGEVRATNGAMRPSARRRR